MISLVVFDGRVTRVAYEDTHQYLFGSCVGRGVEKFISKLETKKQLQKWED